eukprot:CAMPEP_0201123022 /NCGR_PEP_ID=MMETSP0850-20130426/6506_1 /ASSEMBLY_ACC=CAM_ASM_000622 /TAXON_ID=183588 /ORGANISM="Pseudo-nitzschia fraudulenta, Strain WWA7" /LENGTH=65 /DNA_ID=CAMNT_0047389829 /DNA_START=622 /DNA_END=819 /DNA_ORIENTATION=-
MTLPWEHFAESIIPCVDDHNLTLIEKIRIVFHVVILVGALHPQESTNTYKSLGWVLSTVCELMRW